jgi:hypothetical protein
MTQDKVTPSSEVEALRELQELGLERIDGHSIVDLLTVARRRQQARETLAEAQEAFQAGLAQNDETSMRTAYEQAQTARKSLEAITYPEDAAFAARRAALERDRAAARALLAAIDTWWWQRFAQAIADVYANLKTPDRLSQSLAEAETILSRWPEIEGSHKQNAQKRLEEAQNEAAGVAARQFRALLDEAKAWRELAGQTADQDSALQHLVHAEASLDAAGRVLDEVKGGTRNLLKNALSEEQTELQKLRETIIRKFHEAVIARRRATIAAQLEQWQAEYRRIAGEDDGTAKDQKWRYLFENPSEEARALRRRLDEWITLVRLDPDYVLEDELCEVIRRREGNLRRSAELLAEVRRLAQEAFPAGSEPPGAANAQAKAEPYLYAMWCACTEAERLDPDLTTGDDKVSQLIEKVEGEWNRLQTSIAEKIGAIRQQLDNTRTAPDALEGIASPVPAGAAYGEGRPAPGTAGMSGTPTTPAGAGSDALDRIMNGLESVHQSLQDSEQKLKGLEERLSAHLKKPSEWDVALAELRRNWQQQNERLEQLRTGCQAVIDLANAWRTPYDLIRLVERTQALFRQDKLPQPIRQAALERVYRAVREALPAIRKQKPSVPRQIELTLLLRELLQMKRTHYQAKEAI